MSTWEMQVAAVSGASHGIGRALALELARGGAALVLNARSAGALEDTATECRRETDQVRAVAGNVAHAAVAAEMAAKAQELGGASLVVHAAGVLSPGPTVAELPPDDYAAVMDASLGGAFALWQAFAQQLAERGGAFVVFGSGAADIVQPGIGAYCAAKAAEEHLARQLAREEPRVTTFIYRPGIVETRMQEQARNARGGAADAVHATFRPWKDEGRLLSPGHSAAFLLRTLEDPDQDLSGQIVRPR